MESIKILLLCVVAAVMYGIGQDLVTTRVCIEYFTVGHPPIFGGTQDPTLLALGWGVFATWWVGMLLGVPAAFFARAGSKPKLTWRDLRKPIGVLMVVVAISAILAWPVGWLGEKAASALNADRIPGVPGERVAAFMGNLAAHQAGYAVGFLGGVVMWGWIWWRRGRLAAR